MNDKIEILYEDNHLLVVVKPVNMPVQADESKDDDLLSALKAYLKEKYQKPGEVYLGLVHRLDRPVGGVMVFARTSKAASRLSDQVRTHQLQKEYRAVITGVIEPDCGKLVDYLYKDSKTNMVRVVTERHSEAKKATLSYHTIAVQSGYSFVAVRLETGRSHQIRVQFASRNHALWGDQRYNLKAVKGQQIALWAYRLSFQHPTTKEELTFMKEPPKRAPYTFFDK